MSNREWTRLLQHDVSAPQSSRCLVSGCINKMEHFHPSYRWTGSFRPSYPAQGILLKQRHFQGADLDITSVEINHGWILSSTNTYPMPLWVVDLLVSTGMGSQLFIRESCQSIQYSVPSRVQYFELTLNQCDGSLLNRHILCLSGKKTPEAHIN